MTYVDHTEQVRVVTEIRNSYGHTIEVEYDSGSSPIIEEIRDSMGRRVTFSVSSNRLSRITVRNATGASVYYYYTVDAYSGWGGYYRLTRFDPPELPASTYEYDGHTFYFQVQPLETRVVKRKSVNGSDWYYTYPDYRNVPSDEVQVDGPVYNTEVTYHAYSSTSPWKIGLIKEKRFSDGSYSESYEWEPVEGRVFL